jgi:hypothetical protein
MALLALPRWLPPSRKVSDFTIGLFVSGTHTSCPGFNMENQFAIFVTYLAHLMNGNLVTDLLSIGGKTRKTGPDPPPPAHAGGFNVHGTFEGGYNEYRSV